MRIMINIDHCVCFHIVLYGRALWRWTVNRCLKQAVTLLYKAFIVTVVAGEKVSLFKSNSGVYTVQTSG